MAEMKTLQVKLPVEVIEWLKVEGAASDRAPSAVARRILVAAKEGRLVKECKAKPGYKVGALALDCKPDAFYLAHKAGYVAEKVPGMVMITEEVDAAEAIAGMEKLSPEIREQIKKQTSGGESDV